MQSLSNDDVNKTSSFAQDPSTTIPLVPPHMPELWNRDKVLDEEIRKDERLLKKQIELKECKVISHISDLPIITNKVNVQRYKGVLGFLSLCAESLFTLENFQLAAILALIILFPELTFIKESFPITAICLSVIFKLIVGLQANSQLEKFQ